MLKPIFEVFGIIGYMSMKSLDWLEMQKFNELLQYNLSKVVTQIKAKQRFEL